MFRWLQDKRHVRVQDLLPRPDLLKPLPPHAACTDDIDARLLAMLDEDGFRSWPEVIEWLENRVRTLRSDKADLQRQLEATQSFVRFRR